MLYSIPHHSLKGISRRPIRSVGWTNRPKRLVNAPDSPLSRFRSDGILFVTDLSKLAWCELQADYGLRQWRSGPLELRPSSFVSKEGKTISVETAIAAQNDLIMTQGKTIHDNLEKEMPMPEPEAVTISSPEDRWALRLINMMAFVDCLTDHGIARGMPVFGLLNGIVVVGIVDEIIRKPKEGAPPMPSQREIAKLLRDCNDNLDGDRIPGVPYDIHTLQINDTKTRRRNSLPSHPDTLPARIQVMLYRRLLNDLISPACDFTMLWKTLGLDPSETLSRSLLESSGLFFSDVMCLDDVGQLWKKLASTLDAPEVDPNLTLTYRRQDPHAGRLRSPLPNTANSDASPDQIIGTKNFVYEEDFLDAYVSRALKWWLGKREPEGVSADNFRRCFSCEYAKDCEWREQKAMEYRERGSKAAECDTTKKSYNGDSESH